MNQVWFTIYLNKYRTKNADEKKPSENLQEKAVYREWRGRVGWGICLISVHSEILFQVNFKSHYLVPKCQARNDHSTALLTLEGTIFKVYDFSHGHRVEEQWCRICIIDNVQQLIWKEPCACKFPTHPHLRDNASEVIKYFSARTTVIPKAARNIIFRHPWEGFFFVVLHLFNSYNMSRLAF